MNGLLPAPLPLVVSIVAVSARVLLLCRDGHAPPSCLGALLGRLGAAFIIAFGVIALLWLGWLLFWLVEQRW